MNNSTALSLAEIKDLLKSSEKIEFKSQAKNDRNKWICDVMRNQKYFKRSRPDKTLLKKYIMKMTGLSKSQLTRLIKEYKKQAALKSKAYKRNSFPVIYKKSDIELLAEVDNAHSRLSGPATVKILKDDFKIFGKTEYENLKNISVAHLYRLRQVPRYRENALSFSKTNPTKVPIGERRKPEPDGKPGFLCVDTVHQGDKDGEKGAYHINIADMATQFEFVGAVEKISEKYMQIILLQLLDQFPFIVIEFHADNGSEYINKIVAGLLNKLLIRLTKSRPRHSNDNPLIETKNGAVIRKHIGYAYIPQAKAGAINKFYQKYFNCYLNYHRPCAFAEIKIDKKGKEIKTYPKENYMMPYEKLKSLENAKQYLKENITFEDLDKIAYATSHTEYARIVQNEKKNLFNNIFNN
jgi:hypothetical protein